MPKQPDLIADEMQGDATVFHEVAEAADEFYVLSKQDPKAQNAIEALARATELKVFGGTSDSDGLVQSGNGASDNHGGAASRLLPFRRSRPKS